MLMPVGGGCLAFYQMYMLPVSNGRRGPGASSDYVSMIMIGIGIYLQIVIMTVVFRDCLTCYTRKSVIMRVSSYLSDYGTFLKPMNMGLMLYFFSNLLI